VWEPSRKKGSTDRNTFIVSLGKKKNPTIKGDGQKQEKKNSNLLPHADTYWPTELRIEISYNSNNRNINHVNANMRKSDG
jgi:hypothetical protein